MSHRSLRAGKNLKIAQHYCNHYKLFRQVFNVSVSSAKRQIFVNARVFDTCNLTTCYKNVLIAVITVAHHYQRELSNLLSIGYLPAESSNRSTSRRCKICSKLTYKTPKRRQMTSFWCLYCLLCTLYLLILLN